jgi:hypothetical protein
MAKPIRITTVLATTLALSTPALAACNVALSDADIERALAISIGSEYGAARNFIAKWDDEVSLAILGSPTQADKAAVEDIVADLNLLIAPTRINIVSGTADLRVHFAPIDDFPEILPSYEPVNYGYFSFAYNGAKVIDDADVLISTTGLSRAETNHLIREEVTQVLGMGKDLEDQASSIFYGRWTDIQDYSVSDTKVVRAVYCPDVTPGMTSAEIRQTLKREAAIPSEAQIVALQRNLLARGHDIGPADGIVGRRTRDAIRSEQESLGLYVDGEPSLGLLRALKVKSL